MKYLLILFVVLLIGCEDKKEDELTSSHIVLRNECIKRCHGLMVGFMQAKNLLNSFLTNIENKKDELNWVDFKKNNGGN